MLINCLGEDGFEDYKESKNMMTTTMWMWMCMWMWMWMWMMMVMSHDDGYGVTSLDGT